MELEELMKKRLSEGPVQVEVRPSSSATGIVGYNESRGSFKISLSSPPEKNKANLELVRFVSKIVGSEVRIKSGHTSKRKVLVI